MRSAEQAKEEVRRILEQTPSSRSVLKVLGAMVAAVWIILLDMSPAFDQPVHARLAVLTPGLSLESVLQGLREGLGRLGYKEGLNISFIMEDTKGNIDNLDARAAKLLATKPDVLFTVASIHTRAAHQATTAVPIVFAWVGDPVHDGLIAGFASSKNNLTGVTSSSASLSGKRLEVLLELAPRTRRVGVIVSVKESIALSSYRFLEETAKKLGIQLVRHDVARDQDIEQALRKMPKGSVDAFYHLPSVLLRGRMDLLIKKAKVDKIPLVVHDDSIVDQGALLSYGPEARLVGAQAAALVDKVLKGTKPSEIVVETPNRIFLAINVNTAKEIGLKIPRGLMERADRLVE